MVGSTLIEKIIASGSQNIPMGEEIGVLNFVLGKRIIKKQNIIEDIALFSIPLSLKTIMAGVNQTLMLALSMVVIAALIGAGGLGLTVYIALGRLDVGSAVIGGTGIVILAIILDRITQKIIKTR